MRIFVRQSLQDVELVGESVIAGLGRDAFLAESRFCLFMKRMNPYLKNYK
jgi:hypothetical protein